MEEDAVTKDDQQMGEVEEGDESGGEEETAATSAHDDDELAPAKKGSSAPKKSRSSSGKREGSASTRQLADYFNTESRTVAEALRGKVAAIPAESAVYLEKAALYKEQFHCTGQILNDEYEVLHPEDSHAVAELAASRETDETSNVLIDAPKQLRGDDLTAWIKANITDAGFLSAKHFRVVREKSTGVERWLVNATRIPQVAKVFLDSLGAKQYSALRNELTVKLQQTHAEYKAVEDMEEVSDEDHIFVELSEKAASPTPYPSARAFLHTMPAETILSHGLDISRFVPPRVVFTQLAALHRGKSGKRNRKAGAEGGEETAPAAAAKPVAPGKKKRTEPEENGEPAKARTKKKAANKAAAGAAEVDLPVGSAPAAMDESAAAYPGLVANALANNHLDLSALPELQSKYISDMDAAQEKIAKRQTEILGIIDCISEISIASIAAIPASTRPENIAPRAHLFDVIKHGFMPRFIKWALFSPDTETRKTRTEAMLMSTALSIATPPDASVPVQPQIDRLMELFSLEDSAKWKTLLPADATSAKEFAAYYTTKDKQPIIRTAFISALLIGAVVGSEQVMSDVSAISKRLKEVIKQNDTDREAARRTIATLTAECKHQLAVAQQSLRKEISADLIGVRNENKELSAQLTAAQAQVASEKERGQTARSELAAAIAEATAKDSEIESLKKQLAAAKAAKPAEKAVMPPPPVAKKAATPAAKPAAPEAKPAPGKTAAAPAAPAVKPKAIPPDSAPAAKVSKPPAAAASKVAKAPAAPKVPAPAPDADDLGF